MNNLPSPSHWSYLTTSSQREYLPRHATELLVFGLKYGYDDLIDETALLRVRAPLLQTLELMPHEFVLLWVDKSQFV